MPLLGIQIVVLDYGIILSIFRSADKLHVSVGSVEGEPSILDVMMLILMW